MSLSFRVKNLDAHDGVPRKARRHVPGDPFEDTDERGGTYRSVEIATPLGDVAFRFVERSDYRAFAPGFVDSGPGNAARPENRYGIAAVDHVTSNGLTMQPIMHWYKEVLGFEPFWEINFHTQDVAAGDRVSGSGLQSIVMWDPESGVKFATNEPLRPLFRDSQICEVRRGQPRPRRAAHRVRREGNHSRRSRSMKRTRRRVHGHAAIVLPSAARASREARHHERQRGPRRARAHCKSSSTAQDDKYMLQIFMREAKAMYSDERAGPFFYEIIQRAGDKGFGYGNFRALFESIERCAENRR